MSEILTVDGTDWAPHPQPAESARLAQALEAGKVLHLHQLRFEIRPQEKRFLDERWSDRKSKNISFDPPTAGVKGALGNASDLEDLRRLLQRYHEQAVGLVEHLLPAYAAHLSGARTSFRPAPVAGRRTSWRKDDSRLHVDAFPSRPNRGERILRVFANVNPRGEPRVWRVGEPFAQLAQRYLPQIPRPRPGSAALLRALRITKSRRSEYDHIMLELHDRMKADSGYQKNVPQESVAFAAGCVWICFSDQASHAAMSGQYLFEQTLHLPVAGLYDPSSAPLRVLERLAARPLA
jgi:hypothetical protein